MFTDRDTFSVPSFVIKTCSHRKQIRDYQFVWIYLHDRSALIDFSEQRDPTGHYVPPAEALI